MESFQIGLKLAKDYIKEFRAEHPYVSQSIEWAFDYLHPPFNLVAKKIYRDLGGTDEEKADQVMKMLDKIYQQGEDHYNEIKLLLQQNTSG